jgi:hypothetical protein
MKDAEYWDTYPVTLRQRRSAVITNQKSETEFWIFQFIDLKHNIALWIQWIIYEAK